MTMNKMTTTTRAIVTILFIVPEYSIDWCFDGSRTIHLDLTALECIFLVSLAFCGDAGSELA